jgi:hypothetical protein
MRFRRHDALLLMLLLLLLLLMHCCPSAVCISARQIEQAVLPSTKATDALSLDCDTYNPAPKTKLFAYGTTDKNGVSTHNWPSYTIEAIVSVPIS